MAAAILAEPAYSLKDEFDENGFVILRGFFSPEEMDMVLEEIKKAGAQQQGEHCLNKDDMVFFGDIVRSTSLLQSFATQSRVIDLLKDLIGPDFWIRWDQAVGKYPGGSHFPWHQDNAYNKLLDPHFQFWLGLTPMNEENGGLWLQPGSHKLGLLPHSKVDNHLACDVQPCKPQFVSTEKGDVIVFSSLTLHYTTRNISQRERWAWVIEYMSCDYFDPHVSPPYFVVCEDGRPVQKVVDGYKGSLDPRQRMKYLGARTKEGLRAKAKHVLAKATRIVPGKK